MKEAPLLLQLFTSKINNRNSTIINQFPQSIPSHRADRAALDELRFDPRLAGVFFRLADVSDPAHDAVHHRAAAPADMRDRQKGVRQRNESYVRVWPLTILRYRANDKFAPDYILEVVCKTTSSTWL